MLNGGIALTHAVDALANFTDDPALRRVLADIHQKLLSGNRLSAAMAFYPKSFSTVAIAMVRLGEETGALSAAAQRLASWTEREHNLTRKVKSAMVYPAFSLSLTAILTLGLFLFIIPDFLSMLVGLGSTIPLPTKILMGVTGFLTSFWGWLTLGLTAAFVYTTLKAVLSTQQGVLAASSLVSHIPVLGPLLSNTALARYCSAAATLFATGTDLFTTVRLAAMASGSPLLRADVKKLNLALGEGESLSTHMALHEDLYPGIMVAFVAAGEQSARMDDTFEFLGRFYEDLVETQIEIMTSLLEPLIMGILAGVVGFIVISLLLPMHNLLSTLS